MNNDQIMKISQEVDMFITSILDSNNLDIVDLAAIIGVRLRMLSIVNDLEDDYDSLQDHMNSQTILVSHTVH